MRRLRWALIGGVWMAIYLLIHDAYEGSLNVLLLRRFVPDPGPDGSRSIEPWNLIGGQVVMTYLPRMLIAALALGVLVAGWWAVKRWRTKPEQMSTP